MITTYISDLSRVLLFPKDPKYQGELNAKYKEMKNTPNFSFFDYFSLNEELLEYLNKNKSKFELYIFTSGSIQNAPEIKNRLSTIFKGILSAEELGISKKEPRAYTSIAEIIKKDPQELLFIDDTIENILAALEAKLNIVHYLDNQSLISSLEGDLNK